MPDSAVARCGYDPELEMARRIQNRVQERPWDPVSWRLLAKLQTQKSLWPEARESLERAVELDPRSAAALYDLGEVLLVLGEPIAASERFEQAMAMAPGSEQAIAAAAQLGELRGAPVDPEIQLASFRPQWFEPPQAVEEAVAEPAPEHLWLHFETGIAWNSNVGFAPISPDLTPDGQAAFQLFASPEMDYRYIQTDDCVAGVLFESYFTLNEPDASDFDLQHYRPGVYVEFPTMLEGRQIVPRLEYDFAYDNFGGATLGTRHTGTASLSICPTDGPTWIIYWASDLGEFADDGTDPAQDSLDGWTHTLGVSRACAMGGPVWRSCTWGSDLQWADLRGSSYAYRGVMTFLAADACIAEYTTLRPELGLGYRQYPDFTQSPSRDELIIRAGAQLRRWLNHQWYIATECYWDRFFSDNGNFAAERLTAGALLGFEK